MFKKIAIFLACSILMMNSSTTQLYAESHQQTEKEFSQNEIKTIIASAMIIGGIVIALTGGISGILIGGIIFLVGVMVGTNKYISVTEEWRTIPGEAFSVVQKGIALSKKAFSEQ